MSSRYEKITEIDGHRISVDTESDSKRLYAIWNDPVGRQERRRSLRTDDLVKAIETVKSWADRGIVGDPGAAATEAPLETVADVLDAHAPYIDQLASAEAERIYARRIKEILGGRRVVALVLADFEKFRDACLDVGWALSTVDRSLSVLRSGVRRGAQNWRIAKDKVPFIPRFCTKNYLRSRQPKGRILTLDELARLIDAIDHLHLLVYLILLINTAARMGAILDLQRDQIDLDRERLALNPEGRVQTTKWRPVLPVTTTLQPWLENLPPGHLVTWQGARVSEIDTAFATACCHAGLPGGETSYSVRHTLGRFMRRRGVPLEEIAVWLGHIQPPTAPETTLIYSPDDPSYLLNAKQAVEDFVQELAKRCRRDLLTPPWRLL